MGKEERKNIDEIGSHEAYEDEIGLGSVDAESEEDVDSAEFDETELPQKIEGDFDSIYEVWHRLFEMYTWNNEIYHKLLFHALLGQVFKYISIRKGGIELDGRISFLLIQDQGTGKNTPFIPFKKICEEIDNSIRSVPINKNGNNFVSDIRVSSLDEFSESAVIGSKTKVFDPAKKKFDEYENKGILDKSVSDVVAVKEARVLFNDSRVKNTNILQYFNIALEPFWDEGNVIKKHLNSGEIICTSEASTIMTTYPMNFEIETLSTGIFRRLLVCYKEVKLSEKEENLLIGFDKLFTTKENKKKFESIWVDEKGWIKMIADSLISAYQNATKNLFDNGKLVITFDEDVADEMKRFTKEMIKKLVSLPEDELKIVDSIFTSYMDHTLIISAHRAVLDGRMNIRKDDIEYAEGLIREIDLSVIKFVKFVFKSKKNYYEKIELKNEEDWRKAIIKIMSGAPGHRMLKLELEKRLEDDTGKTKQTIYNHIKRFEINENDAAGKKEQASQMKREGILKLDENGYLCLVI